MTKSLGMPCDSCQQEKREKLHYFTYSIVFNVELHSLPDEKKSLSCLVSWIIFLYQDFDPLFKFSCSSRPPSSLTKGMERKMSPHNRSSQRIAFSWKIVLGWRTHSWPTSSFFLDLLSLCQRGDHYVSIHFILIVCGGGGWEGSCLFLHLHLLYFEK